MARDHQETRGPRGNITVSPCAESFAYNVTSDSHKPLSLPRKNKTTSGSHFTEADTKGPRGQGMGQSIHRQEGQSQALKLQKTRHWLLSRSPQPSTCNIKCLSLAALQASLKALGSDCFQYQSDSSSLTMKDLNVDHLNQYVPSSHQ